MKTLQETTVEEMLAKGFVPSHRVAPVLRRLLHDSFGEDFATTAAGNLPRLLYKIEHEQDFVDFDSVDRAFCKLWAEQVWRDELEDLYYGTTLKQTITVPPNTCARRGCSVRVERKNTGGHTKRFCSHTCRVTDYARRSRGVKRCNIQTSFECSKGHALDDGNSYIDSSGYRRCTRCRKEARRKYEAKRRAARSARGKRVPSTSAVAVA